MKKHLMIATIILGLIQVSFIGRDPKWFERRMRELDKSIQIDDTRKRIEELGKFLGIASNGEMDNEQKIIFDKAQATILSIPGHAKHYQDKIEKMRAELLENSKRSAEEIIKMHDDGKVVLDEPTYLGDAEIAIRMLRFMPSAETVSVLGYFLNDPVARDGKTLLGSPLARSGDSPPVLSNAEVATDVIRALGIEHPPFRDSKGVITPEEIDAWKGWWNEVKDGKRTYRFIGSKIEYGPDGPASKEIIQHVERDRKRDEEREAGYRKSSPARETDSTAAVAAKPLSIAGILAACALIGAAVWYYLKGRRAA